MYLIDILESNRQVWEDHASIDLDNVLRDLIKLVHKGQKHNPKKYGLVAASVIDPNGNRVDRVNYISNKTGRRIHAERAAVEAYVKKFGDDLSKCTVVTTCSPCSEHMDDREGPSCSDYLDAANIRNIYCGYRDPGQESGYITTADEDILNKCADLAKHFANPPTLRESRNNAVVRQFLPWLQQEIGIEKLPKIEFLDQPNNTSFGGYNNKTKTLQVVTAGRHPVDVLRTLAHELVHRRQDIEGQLHANSGETGSDQENEANAEAGIVMRNFAKLNPDAFGLKEDFTGKPKPGSRPGSLLRKAGKKKGEKIHSGDLVRMRGQANRMKKSTNKATRDRGIQLQRQLNWYKNFHKKKSEAVGSEE